jgi:threonine dehydrogenase-like Zn-dependent dehydrogenase
MKAFIYSKLEKKAQLLEISKPIIEEKDETFFYPLYVAICGSDLHMFLGSDAYNWVKENLVLGHEIVGFIDNEHDLYVVNPYIPCGKCELCQIGETNYCTGPKEKLAKTQPPYSLQYGFRKNGGLAEIMVVKKENLIKVPYGLNAELCAFSEALAVGYRAVMQSFDLLNRAPSTALVIGPGPIGMGISFVLKGKGINVCLLGLEKDFERLEIAKKMGIYCATSDVKKIKEYLKQFGNGEADLVFEASGSKKAYEIVLSLVKRRGVIMSVGIGDDLCTLSMRQLVRGGVIISGSYGVLQEDIIRVLDLLNNNKKEATMFIDKIFQFSEVNNAFEYALKAKAKVLIHIGGNKNERNY